VFESVYASGNPGEYSTHTSYKYRLSATFLQNNTFTIPFFSENQEKSWKHRFLTFF